MTASPLDSDAMTNAHAAPTDRRVILLILCLAVLIAQVDTSVVNLAVHAIGVGLHAPLPALQWVLDGYNLSYAALLMTGGTLADLLGRRRVLMAGAAVFVLGSLLAGLAPNITALIAGRVLAGIGAAMLLPASLALIRVIWDDPHERAHAIGVWAGTNGAALAIGPTLGGWLIQTVGWRSVFLLIVPIGLAVLLWAPRAIPESRDAQGRRVDLPGQLFGGLALAALAVAAIVHRLLLPAVAVALLAALLFVRAERRAGTGAMIPLPLLRNARLAAVNGVAAAMTFGMYGVLFLLPLNWLRANVLDATGAGLALLPMSLAFVALSHRSGPWSVRYGMRRLMVGGMALIGAGIAVLACSHAGQNLWLAETGLLLTGVGMALNTGPVLASAVAAVEPARAGTASAMINTARMVGATLGVGVLGSVFAAGGSPPAGFTLAMGLGVVVVFAGAVLALRKSDR
ncbi:Major facilitator superfamily MFS_1 [Thiomonas sp. Bio17B3]|nr:Major facilitator superfamily MFS_1 [Thiomonas sp. Bio17B3]VDY07172.1 Major facilitator superfamily MFS_1 [Thiomonas sp. Sup16B3]VDY13921.1 Major facilitator superfamily MFS_1 [Thiomonas sp. OC7]